MEIKDMIKRVARVEVIISKTITTITLLKRNSWDRWLQKEMK